MAKAGKPEIKIEADDTGLYVVFDGAKIARRGDPDSPQAKTWVLLDPRYTVTDLNGGKEIEILRDGVLIH